SFVEGATPTGRRRLPFGRMALAAAAVIVLLGMIARFTGDDDPDGSLAALPEDTAALVVTVPVPPVPPAPDSAAIAAIWQEMALAEEEDFEDEFDAATERLQAAEARLEVILAEFPDDSVVRLLADSLQGQMNATSLRCITLRT